MTLNTYWLLTLSIQNTTFCGQVLSIFVPSYACSQRLQSSFLVTLCLAIETSLLRINKQDLQKQTLEVVTGIVRTPKNILVLFSLVNRAGGRVAHWLAQCLATTALSAVEDEVFHSEPSSCYSCKFLLPNK